MATQFSELQKLLINVGKGKCDVFIKKHVNAAWEGPTETGELPVFNIDAGINDVYYNKIVFLQDYNAIYTKGTFFGYNGDLKASFEASFEDLVEGLKTGLSANGITVKYNPNATDGPAIETTVEAAKYNKDSDTWDNPDNVVTASEVQTYVEDYVKTAVDAAAVTAMEYKGGLTQAGFDAFANVEDKKSLDGNVYVADEQITLKPATETEKAVIAEKGDTIIVHCYKKDEVDTLDYVVIERNVDNTVTASGNFKQNQILVAADNNQTAQTTGYFLGSDATTYTAFGTQNTLATEVATAAYVVGKLGELDASVTYNANVNNYVSYSYNQTDGLITYVNVGLKVAEYTYTEASEDTPATFTYNTYGLIDHNVLNDAISYLDGKIDAVDCEVTTLTTVADSDYFSVTEDSTDKTDNDRNYTIELNVVSLGDAVGMTYDEATGKWSAPKGSSAVNGLASAADVANELVSDEKVIAAALNDHEGRLDVLEAFADDINGTIQNQLVIGEVTVDGLTATPTKEGLVNVQLLVDVINALDPWEDYE